MTVVITLEKNDEDKLMKLLENEFIDAPQKREEQGDKVKLTFEGISNNEKTTIYNLVDTEI